MDLIETIELWASLLEFGSPQRRILVAVIDELKKGKNVQITAVRYVMAQYGATTTSPKDEAILVGMDLDDWQDERDRLKKRFSA